MALVSTRDLKQDVLFRASEATAGSSGWESKVIDYLNRVYYAVSLGTSEYLPEHVPDWWWMREKASLILEPVYSTGTVSVTQGSPNITFSGNITASKTGWKFKVDDHPDVFDVQSHGAGTADAILDTVYTGETDGSAGYKLMKTTYTLAADVAGLVSPMMAFRDIDRIDGTTPERMDQLYPLNKLSPGNPLLFSLEDEGTVRFSHGGRTDGLSMRVDYRYKPIVTALTDSDSSIPLVPLQYRHVLADMALVYVMIDKNDNRANSMITSSRSILTSMYNENKHRLAKIDGTVGWVLPRLGYQSRMYPGPLRTETGLIIG